MFKIKGTELYFIKEIEPKIRINGAKRRMAIFRCACGDESVKPYETIKGKSIKSCLKCSIKKRAEKRSVHGLIKHPLYAKWNDMKNRCYNENVDRYNCYGGIGIGVCDEWRKNFKSFYDWSIKNGWGKNLTIDRIDVTKDYSPENCRYISMVQQGFNKRNTFYVNISENESVGLSELLHLNNKHKKYKAIWTGIKKGKPMEYYIKKNNLKLDFDFISYKKTR